MNLITILFQVVTNKTLYFLETQDKVLTTEQKRKKALIEDKYKCDFQLH